MLCRYVDMFLLGFVTVILCQYVKLKTVVLKRLRMYVYVYVYSFIKKLT